MAAGEVVTWFRERGSTCIPSVSFETVVRYVKQSAFESYNKISKISPNFNLFKPRDMKILRDLSKLPNLIVTRPDKGRGVVLMNKSDYTSKMQSILSDSSKFVRCSSQDAYKLALRAEDKILRLLRSMKNKKVLHPSTYEDIHPVGSGPGILYGLPKVHKPGAPLRPILGAYNTAAYKCAKFLVPLLEPLTTNTYTVRNSYEFKNSICSLTGPSTAFMCSYDVTSLFTNIPLTETIDIICQTLFPTGSEIFHNFTKSDFNSFLTLVVSDPLFIFDGVYYTQSDGVAMGSPLGPTLANIFLSHHEKKWLDDCPLAFKPYFENRVTKHNLKGNLHIENVFYDKEKITFSKNQ